MRIADDASAANHAADMRECAEVNRRIGLQNRNVRDHPRHDSTSFRLHTLSPAWILSQRAQDLDGIKNHLPKLLKLLPDVIDGEIARVSPKHQLTAKIVESANDAADIGDIGPRSEEHTSELQ